MYIKFENDMHLIPLHVHVLSKFTYFVVASSNKWWTCKLIQKTKAYLQNEPPPTSRSQPLNDLTPLRPHDPCGYVHYAATHFHYLVFMS